MILKFQLRASEAINLLKFWCKTVESWPKHLCLPVIVHKGLIWEKVYFFLQYYFLRQSALSECSLLQPWLFKTKLFKYYWDPSAWFISMQVSGMPRYSLRSWDCKIILWKTVKTLCSSHIILLINYVVVMIGSL